MVFFSILWSLAHGDVINQQVARLLKALSAVKQCVGSVLTLKGFMQRSGRKLGILEGRLRLLCGGWIMEEDLQ
jgi:hypothetical protein